ncbi:MAG: hypothetical protein PUP92_29745 [Rhizonema sp. PD38]|nr:hypothetical protein [Rhizonema sp. PD38]
MHINYTVQIWKEDSQFVAHAMPIDVMSSGLSTAIRENLPLFAIASTNLLDWAKEAANIFSSTIEAVVKIQAVAALLNCEDRMRKCTLTTQFKFGKKTRSL